MPRAWRHEQPAHEPHGRVDEVADTILTDKVPGVGVVLDVPYDLGMRVALRGLIALLVT